MPEFYRQLTTARYSFRTPLRWLKGARERAQNLLRRMETREQEGYPPTNAERRLREEVRQFLQDTDGVVIR